jgi:hypothetical protein
VQVEVGSTHFEFDVDTQDWVRMQRYSCAVGAVVTDKENSWWARQAAVLVTEVFRNDSLLLQNRDRFFRTVVRRL